MDFTLTIISLMIGVFGATASVVFLLRADCVAFINSKLSDADEKYKAVLDTAPNPVNIIKNSLRCMKFTGVSSTYILFVPIILFSLWAFSTSFYLSKNNDCKQYFSSGINTIKSMTLPKLNQQPDDSNLSKEETLTKSSKIYFLFNSTTLFWVTLIDSIAVIAAILLWFVARVSYWLIVSQHKTVIELLSSGINKT